MAKFLLSTLPFVGHVAPMQPVAQQLIARGHEVVWYTSKFFQSQVENTGARFVPITSCLDYGDGDYDKYFPERAALKGIAQLKFDFKYLFIESISGYLLDLESILSNFPADVLLGDPAVVAVKILGDKLGIPWAYLNISVLGLASHDVPLFGLGMMPSYSPLGRARNAALYWLSDQFLFADVQKHFNKLAKSNGFEPFRFGPTVSPWLYLQPSVPSFEYMRTDLPPTVHFIGPLEPNSPPDTQMPQWWNEVINTSKPIVLVTQGTVATQTQQLIEPTLQALANEDVLVVTTTGGKTQEQLKINLPANVRIASFIPFSQLMPHVCVYVTNGGYGGVTIALSHGVPIISGGQTEDKPEVSNRIAYSGVGINLKTATPKPRQIRNAVKKVLSDHRYRLKAQEMKAVFANYHAAETAAQLLEKLAMTKKPVYASLPQEAYLAGWRQTTPAYPL
ncbi:glycosyltransferase [Nostoc sp. FACHB-152]|uniref:glycosyltransferase n=1 Tax=unclassified Nostoc TaxID=2593658 RepID=UPI0016881442|nr:MULTISPECIES: nucleotide disphospho-sugar-binding domain-containing protein [unclassified Nostoc]MBD2448545.1 glycosyltransferase [Nostoc sp. FACHB-152]MBD2470258.1 glycosyltransferase [Nostoc sp. FACHB-145]